MPRTVEFVFDVVSPTAYIAWKRLPLMVSRTGATLKWSPVFLGGIMQATGNKPPGTVPAKGRYMDVDVPRCAAHFGIPYAPNPHFPVNTLLAQRAAAVLLDDGDEASFRRLMDACFDAIWVESKNLGEPAVAAAVLVGAGLDAGQLVARASTDAAKARLKSNTSEAVERGVFGAPTFFVGEQMFFGQDRMEYVEAALRA